MKELRSSPGNIPPPGLRYMQSFGPDIETVTGLQGKSAC